MVHSFKTKMALFSLCTSGLTLVAFAMLLVSVVRNAGLNRLDRQMRLFADGPMRNALPMRSDLRPETTRNARPNDREHRLFPMRVIGRDGYILSTSPDWPSALEAERFSTFFPPSFGESPQPPLPQWRRTHETPSDRPPPMLRRSLPPPVYQNCVAGNKQWRVLIIRNAGMTFLIAGDLSELKNEMRRFSMIVFVSGAGGLVLFAAGGWLLAGLALRPIKILTETARHITSKELHERIQVAGSDVEFQSLIDVINGMLERLEKSFRQAQRFSADAAHELKTPLTILQGQLDHAVRHAPEDSSEQRLCLTLLEEVQRLKSIIRKLLLLAHSDAGQLSLTLRPISLSRQVAACCEDLPLLGPDLTLQCACDPDVIVPADEDLFRQLLQNLFSNAVKYNREKGSITCQLVKEGHQAVLTLSNTLPENMRLDPDRLFERFYRGDPSRSREKEGCGLGLSLAREISRAHGGDLVVAQRSSESITFRLTCPLRD